MNKIISLFSIISILCCFISCSKDTKVADPYSDWETRNSIYLDSIISVCKNPPVGEQWESYVNYKLWNDNQGITTVWGATDFVYMKKLPYDENNPTQELGISPMGTDSVFIHYCGRLINGTTFYQSYYGDWEAEVDEPIGVVLTNLITGWATALLHMKEGERAEIYIPYNMGYGTEVFQAVPGYSTLIFDVRLEKVKHPTGPDDRLLKRLK